MIDLLGNYGWGLSFTKGLVSEKYRRFIRSQFCEASLTLGDRVTPCEAHHIIYQSRKNACSDIFLMPLITKYHTNDPLSYHVMGRERFVAHWGLDLNAIVIKHIENYTGLSVSNLLAGETDRNRQIAILEYTVKQVK